MIMEEVIARSINLMCEINVLMRSVYFSLTDIQPKINKYKYCKSDPTINWLDLLKYI